MSHQDHNGTGGCGCHGSTALVFDEQGDLVEDVRGLGGPPGPEPRPQIPEVFPRRPCSMSRLNGSWLVQIRPLLPAFPFSEIRGPMRIEVGASSLRISGDIYVRRTGVIGPVATQPLTVPAVPDTDAAQEAGQDTAAEALAALGSPRLPWYPQFALNQYSWYFRSTGVTYAGGQLSYTFVRHLWDRTTQEFVSTDSGRMTLQCHQPFFEPIPRPATMTGTATIGGAPTPSRRPRPRTSTAAAVSRSTR